MIPEATRLNLTAEATSLVQCLENGDTQASIHLARLIETDESGVFQPFADAVTARLSDHLLRWAELGETNPAVTLEDEVYQILKTASTDWDGIFSSGRPGEES
ncbi:MAG: hypothetical protein D6768_03995 [Chloroflexi bacterium]|nr:MAG: hypothetical protein D6768_03995 [Chloroflexota bacterium]